MYKNDLFLLELDGSYQKRIIHFTQELSLLFNLEDDHFEFIEGDETGPEYSEYDSSCWDYIKERFGITDDFIISKIKDFIDQE